jgi:CheY-like chemotaxis protein
MSSDEPSRLLPKVLLIDDDLITREVLAMMLEMHGFAVDLAEDGKQALELLDKMAELPGVVLMDTQMPGVSGVRLIKALRQRFKTTGARGHSRVGNSRVRVSKIVAISGSQVGESILRAADGFLLKPIQVESLLALLDPQSPSADAAIAGIAVQASAAPEIPVAPASADELEIHDPIVDPIVLGKLKAMMSPAALQEVYSAVASDLEGRLATLEAAMDAGDAPEVARIAHTIKGGCGMVGLSSAQQAASRLETSNLPETWPKELLQLHFAWKQLQGILENGLL